MKMWKKKKEKEEACKKPVYQEPFPVCKWGINNADNWRMRTDSKRRP